MSWVFWLSTFYICEKGGTEGCLKEAVTCSIRSPMGWGEGWGWGVEQDLIKEISLWPVGPAHAEGHSDIPLIWTAHKGWLLPAHSIQPSFLSALPTAIKEELFVIASLLYPTICFSRAGTVPVWITTESSGPRSDADLSRYKVKKNCWINESPSVKVSNPWVDSSTHS